MINFRYLFIITLSLFSFSCGQKMANNSQTANSDAYHQVSPMFDADSAYTYVDKQVAFGPRVPNTSQHVACGDYLVGELKRFGASVTEQHANLKAYNNTMLKSRNIIGSFNVENSNRVLLFAHWDTRPFSDNDPNADNHRKPVLGANDGASGVGVLLEIARAIQLQKPTVGVDIIFFDSEDYGEPSFDKNLFGNTDSWCLGSQHWAKNPHVANYQARFGILLDMVGAANATFYKEHFSKQYAGSVVNKVWSTAHALGYGNYFVDMDGGAITDDHLPVNRERRIPSIDIIQHDPNSDSGFGSYWHTQQDDMSNINKETLKAVGQTVLEVLYREQ